MNSIKYTELLGDNVKPLLKFCGENVKLYSFCKINNPQCAELDDNSEILDFAFIDAKESFKLGKYSLITWHCVVEGNAHVTIGDRCFLGPGTKVLGSTYEFNGYYTCEHLPEGTHATKYGDITICDDAYIGANSVIMPGVTIGEGALVGANSLITHDLEPWCIYFGSPAKKLGKRQKPTDERKAIIDAMNWKKNF